MAFADTFRAAGAILSPIVVVPYIIMTLADKGYGIVSYLEAVAALGAGGLIDHGLGWLCVATWIVQFCPPAWVALWDGPCLLSRDEKDLFLPRNQTVSLSTIMAITFRRTLFTKIAYFETSKGRIALNLRFVRDESRDLLRALAASDNPFA